MADIDWTAVIVAFIGGGGTLTAIIGLMIHNRRPRDKDAEDRVATAVSTPASPATTSHDVQAIHLASQAMEQVKTLSEQLCRTESRLGEVERELGLFRRSYHALYWWAQRLLYDWDHLRESPDPPPLPADIHHPET